MFSPGSPYDAMTTSSQSSTRKLIPFKNQTSTTNQPPVELFPLSFQDENKNKNVTENKDQPNIPNISYEESSEELNEFVEDETNETSELTSLEEFGQFLDIWIEISTSKIEEITQIYEDEEEILTSEVEDIDHLAVDPNSK
ncbi:5221_t:CDS:2 [Dentiscutata erythropus]|uniref:5221_t:CDS:1 n=1 Tax=Dentiscutata erythropus TaxID=1348616 RepID=A0A9N9G122_9GLOM|nr:5221_t:CDS:2 [Dentiscutata erythropus]